MPPPFVAVVLRRTAQQAPDVAISQLNQRVPEIVYPQKSPDPIRYGDTPARKAKQQIYGFLAKKQIRSVMADSQSGVFGKTQFNQFTKSPKGKALAFNERTNIARGYPRAYGTNFNLVPQSEDEFNLRALLGV